MISPTAEYARVLFGALLLVVVALLVLRAVRKDRREYQRFKSFIRSDRRQRMYRKWLIQSATVFGGGSLLLLALLWRHVPLLLADINGVAWIDQLRSGFSASGALGPGIMLAGSFAVLALLVIGVFAARRGDPVASIGDIVALLPRNRAELRYGAALSINAGIVEELMFRLAIPTLIFAVTRNGAVSFALAVVLFALLHLYQGAEGVVGSGLIGVVLMTIFVATGSIVAAIIVHAFIDLRSLVLIPLVVNRVWNTDVER
ncbi:MAG: CPBP family intramembrane metalloprotease [Microbacteriaceae bacterium]|nr:CPBP family intramembrane metalloprotease [Microbacteriaceae bacterium]